MALPMRPRTIPHCSACLRGLIDSATSESTWTTSKTVSQQIRGKKNARPTGTVPVRLLKDLPGFGKRGAVIPVRTGEMRNKWFPRRVADYVPQTELKYLRANNVPIERDYSFNKTHIPSATLDDSMGGSMFDQANVEPVKPMGPEKLTPERSIQLLEIFVKPVVEFYRQPIIEDKGEEVPVPPPERNEGKQRSASSAAADLLAARLQPLPGKAKSTSPQAIYGSVSLHDVLTHIRASIAINDEAARVLLTEGDIRFMDAELQLEGKAKHIGDFTVEITIKGTELRLKRTVRIKPQEL